MQRLFTFCVLGTMVVHMLSVFGAIGADNRMLPIVSLATIITAILFYRLKSVVSLVLLATGGIIFWRFGAPWDTVLAGFSQMTGLVALMILTPVVGLVLEDRQYVKAVFYSFRRFLKNRIILYTFITIVAHLLGGMILFGSIPVLYYFFGGEKRERGEEYLQIVVKAILRGYSSSTLWSPNFALGAVALQSLGLKWMDTLSLGLVMAVVALSANVLVQLIEYWVGRKYRASMARRQGLGSDEAAACDQGMRLEDVFVEPSFKHVHLRVVELGVLFVSFIVAVVMLENWTNLGLVNLVPLTSLSITVFFFVGCRKWHQVGAILRTEVIDKLREHGNEICLILAAGFLSSSLEVTGLGKVFMLAIESVLSRFSLDLLTGIPLLMLVLGFLGLPPLASITIIGGALDTSTLVIAPKLLVLAMLSGAAMTLVFAPFAVSILFMRGVSGRKLSEIGPKWNGFYTIVLFALLELTLHAALQGGW